ncbi:hypothetical protein MCOR02_006462 [Pyricularia oryzae]|uniref:Histone deacetylase n=1 Tax=Pyricularia oryzae TaxID=318829 RepID=A0A4P7NJ96_PYROR|nr:hypothetical protein MCOR02_006462 [Pyricularia oryzae]KAI6273960.1 hypothetical protein MCOR34_011541 [Pyricularia oryzae]KAI6443930.1 hypothetical protein MCOR17_011303 [Pyricularia oryzae]KAI6507136.1 hypothetical protein MCOR13_002933 [Pyricularia oryzae]KAI6570436.1 hypothetical protein MCOR04_008104 [Pyricularia oryzae]
MEEDAVMEGDGPLPVNGDSNGYPNARDIAAGFNDDQMQLQFGDDEDGDVQLHLEDDGDNELELYNPRDFPDDLRRRGLLPTGCCYDDRMKLHANADFGAGPHHPEDPSRIEAIFKTFKQAGLVFTGTDSELIDIIANKPSSYMWRIPAREATKEEICLVHYAKHYDWVKELSTKPTAELRRLTKELDKGQTSVYVGSLTFEASLISAGGAIETCKSIVSGQIKNGFAVIRPPGHHAEQDSAMGFCIFNNVPIAAKVCQAEYPEICQKVLILDWDVHHGNGIQNVFYEDPNVLYISLHVYKNGEFYPGKPENPMTADGSISSCGSGPGLGRNINIGWDDQGMGDGEYIAAFQKIIMPIAHEFNPDLVIISAGFDAAAGDQLGGCFVTPPCYAYMTHMLMSLAHGRVAVCLEGGYNLSAISKSALAVARTLMGEPPPKMGMASPKINREAARLLAQVQAYQAPYWECMRPGVVDVEEEQRLGSERLHDVIRQAQKWKLSKDFGMLPLYIQRENAYKSFENQVLVTPRIHLARKIMVIIHDAPELLAQPDPLDNHLDPHNAWVNDGVYQYINWAVKEKFGVIDVNVPQYITRPEDTDAHTRATDERELQRQILEITTFIWDNYLQLYDSAEDIFLIGVGAAYLGIKTLLINRECKPRISGVVSFVTGNLRPVKSDVDPDLSTWYRDNSRIYVGSDHACWLDNDLTRKVNKRRFGAVKRSPVTGLARMMREHAQDAQAWIRGRVRTPEDGGDTTEEDDGVRE